MTEEEQVVFIREKVAPIFDGMNGEDVINILEKPYDLKRIVLSQLRVSLNSKTE